MSVARRHGVVLSQSFSVRLHFLIKLEKQTNPNWIAVSGPISFMVGVKQAVLSLVILNPKTVLLV